MASKTKPAVVVAWQQLSENMVFVNLMGQTWCNQCDRDVAIRPHANDCPFAVVRDFILKAAARTPGQGVAMAECLELPDGEGWWWYTPTAAQKPRPVQCIWWPDRGDAWVCNYQNWSTNLPGIWQRVKPFETPAPPPETER